MDDVYRVVYTKELSALSRGAAKVEGDKGGSAEEGESHAHAPDPPPVPPPHSHPLEEKQQLKQTLDSARTPV